MKNPLLLASAAACLLAFGGQQGYAQTGVARPGAGQMGTPAYSPYLNINRGGASPSQNYFGVVRPQLDFQATAQSLQQQIATSGQSAGGLDTAAPLAPTGHTTRFLSTGRYFLSFGGSGGGTRPGRTGP
jgi:hypothetical protein